MKNYVHDSIDFEHFKIAFSRLWKDSMKEDKALQIDLKGLKNFELDPKSDGFGIWVTAVFCQFEVLEDEECTEQEVKDYVRNTLQEIQPYLYYDIVLISEQRNQNLKHYKCPNFYVYHLLKVLSGLQDLQNALSEDWNQNQRIAAFESLSTSNIS
jgi:hypothetical protein